MPFKNNDDRKAWRKAWMAAHPEKKREYAGRYRGKNAERVRTYMRGYMQEVYRKRREALGLPEPTPRPHRRHGNRPAWKSLGNKASTYKTTVETLLRIYRASRGHCQICNRRIRLLTGTCFDHNHVTGEVRGCLCNTCNTGFGLLRENPEILAGAIAYAKRTSPRNPAMPKTLPPPPIIP